MLVLGENQSTIKRPLGKIENFFKGLTKCGLFNNFNSLVILDKPLQLEQDRQLVKDALCSIMEKYPMLACNVVGNEVSIVNSFNLDDDVIEFWTIEEDQDFSIEGNLTKMDSIRFQYDALDKVLFKVIIINGTYVHFTSDHALFDGRSSLAILFDFVEQLNRYSSDSSGDLKNYRDHLFESLDTVKLPPPIETLVDFIGPVSDEPRPEAPAINYWRSKQSHVGQEHFFETIQLSLLETAQVQNICKSSNVSMTPYMQHCFLYAQSKVWKTFTDPQTFHGISYGVDCRRYVTDSEASLSLKYGCNVSGNLAVLPNITEFDWNLVKKESDLLKKVVQDGSVNYGFGSFVVTAPAETDWSLVHSQNSILNGTATRGNIMFTNIGKMDLPSSDKPQTFKIQRTFFSQSAHQLQFVFTTNIVSSDGCMTIVDSMVKNDEFTLEEFQKFNRLYKQLLLNPN